MITDYFLTAPVEVAPLSGSDSESDSPDTDSSPQTTDADVEEDTTKDRPLVSDPVAETLQTAAGHYVSEDSANETEKACA
ncbi:Major facilitator superfamily domain containing protein 6-A [Dissostichus eleginoides]|uniref:Major facilitator superfamily domain containing protein 6-A n=1 Tax=Dissostichus eleginoides TaxID=100907 RepID=A0AAD9ETT9_DISEL|nr:Major facilitator superfamily domain containing protein 6-A [Dissostichus eleginoides]